jgi:hypothetical protein
LESRYYNPEWGRFINADAIAAVTGELLSTNMFAYCINNPINMKDSDGFRPVFDSDEQEQAYQDWLNQQQEDLEEKNATDRLRPSDAKKREKRNVDKAWGKRGSKEREGTSEAAHKAKKKFGKGNDDNFGWGDLKGQDFDNISIGIGTRILIGTGGVLLLGGTLIGDIVTGAAGIADDGITVPGGMGMVIKAFAN